MAAVKETVKVGDALVDGSGKDGSFSAYPHSDSIVVFVLSEIENHHLMKI